MAVGAADRVRHLVARCIEQASIPPGSLILAAVSGGQDSLCLLDVLGSVLPKIGVRLAIVHVEHGLRRPASLSDATSVAQLATGRGLECRIVHADVAGYAREHALGLEEAGRYVRYQALAVTAAEQRAWGAATGHTLDDLAETLLINIIRGTGPTGLASISAVQEYLGESLGPAYTGLSSSQELSELSLRVVRPLLGVTRVQTEQYCLEAGIRFTSDPSNVDPSFLRNRIRHHLIPLLRTYNPSIILTLGRLARLAADDQTDLGRLADEAWRRLARATQTQVAFDWDGWLSQSAAIQRRLLAHARIALRVQEVWPIESLEAARLLLGNRPARRRLALGGGVQLVTSRQGFRLEKSAQGRG